MKTKSYQPRTYRTICQHGQLVNFNVMVKESDLLIRATRDLSKEALEILQRFRNEIDNYIVTDQNFLNSLVPIEVPKSAPETIKAMARSSTRFGVGPMAAVAGAIAEGVAKHLNQYSPDVIVENGGDIYIISNQPTTVGIFAGNSPLSMKLGIGLTSQPKAVSVCTSSGTVGHSLSFGKADAVTIIAQNGCFADAAATAVGNIVKTENDIESALEFVRNKSEIIGAIVIINDKIGITGKSIKLVNLTDD